MRRSLPSMPLCVCDEGQNRADSDEVRGTGPLRIRYLDAGQPHRTGGRRPSCLRACRPGLDADARLELEHSPRSPRSG
jgi:hypothetical protein